MSTNNYTDTCTAGWRGAARPSTMVALTMFLVSFLIIILNMMYILGKYYAFGASLSRSNQGSIIDYYINYGMIVYYI